MRSPPGRCRSAWTTWPSGTCTAPRRSPASRRRGATAGARWPSTSARTTTRRPRALVEVGGGRTTTRQVALEAARPLVRLRGPLDDLAALASAHPDAWFACEVELEGPAMDVVHRVREAVPGALRVEPAYASPGLPPRRRRAAPRRAQPARAPRPGYRRVDRPPGASRLAPAPRRSRRSRSRRRPATRRPEACARSSSSSPPSAPTTGRRSTCARTSWWSSRATPARARRRCSTRRFALFGADARAGAARATCSRWATRTARCG